MSKDLRWFSILDFVIDDLKILLNHPSWDSLIVNKRKPHTYRAWRTLDPSTIKSMGGPDIDEKIRICLHFFEPCSPEEAFKHPHPWPGAFKLLEGSYVMWSGLAPNSEEEPVHAFTTELHSGSKYAITNPLVWHSVQPITQCWSIMVNGEPYDTQHQAAPTTKGKDLDKFSPQELKFHLEEFRKLIED